jgi:hypothetical protein
MPPRSSGKSIAILVLGIAGLVFTCAYGFGVIAAIVALALAPGANREIRASGGALTGEGMVKAGVICAWISVALTLVGVVLVVLLIIGGTVSNSTSLGVPGGSVAHAGAGLLALAGTLPQWRSHRRPYRAPSCRSSVPSRSPSNRER